jgi:hypothetical protein
MSQLITYLGKPELKATFLEQITLHETQDAFIKGTYGQMNGHFRGCAIGCSLHSLNVLQGKTDPAEAIDMHSRYESELGLPTWLAHLEDSIFERLPDALSQTWPRRFAEAIPVGATVDDRVLARILHWCLADAQLGVRTVTDDVEMRGYIDTIATLLDAEANGTATADQREAVRAARIARAAMDVWDARAVRAVRAVRAAMDVWDVWDARAARDARDAMAARAAWAAMAAKAADKFYPALSEYVLTQLSPLSVPGAR